MSEESKYINVLGSNSPFVLSSIHNTQMQCEHHAEFIMLNLSVHKAV